MLVLPSSSGSGALHALQTNASLSGVIENSYHNPRQVPKVAHSTALGASEIRVRKPSVAIRRNRCAAGRAGLPLPRGLLAASEGEPSDGPPILTVYDIQETTSPYHPAPC